MAAPKGNKNAKGNKGGGRKTLYKTAYANQAYKLTMLGATDKQLAEFFDVNECTINDWKKKYIDFFQALKKGKETADAEVVMKLFKRATGYRFKEVSYEKIVFDTDEKENIQLDAFKKRVTVKEVSPDTTAQIFWLKNRQKDKWKDRHHNSMEIDFDRMDDDTLDLIIQNLKQSNGEKR